jgi:hypothetical protein
MINNGVNIIMTRGETTRGEQVIGARRPGTWIYRPKYIYRPRTSFSVNIHL